MSKVPKVSLCFWLIKVMISGADVFWPDYLFRQLGTVIVSFLIVLTAAAAIAAQLRADQYRPWIFWPATVAVSVVGTEAANGLHAELRLPYAVASVANVVILAVLLAWWRLSEKTLSLTSIRTTRREAFYWSAALAAFALGSALGHSVLVGGAWIWPAVTAVIALAWWRLSLSPAIAFWSAYASTRPLGAEIAGLLAGRQGAIRFGQWPVSAALAFIAIILVTHQALTGRDVLHEPA